jgi:hypothetical protein
VKDNNIPPVINWRKLEIEDYGHRWVKVDKESYGYWPDGVNNDPSGRTKMDPMQELLDKGKLPPEQAKRLREEPWVFDPDKEFEHGPKMGQSCKDATVQDIKDCIRECAQSTPSRRGPWRLPDNTCQRLPPDCLGGCCMSQPDDLP